MLRMLEQEVNMAAIKWATGRVGGYEVREIPG